MAVVDRWHTSSDDPNDYCKQHGVKGRNKSEHNVGKRWQVRWYDKQGNQPKKNFNTWTEANNFWTDVSKDLKDGTYINRDKSATLFRDYSSGWLETVTGDSNTVATYERDLRLHIWPHLGHRSLIELERNPSYIQRWLAQDKRAAISRRNDFYLVSAILRWAVIEAYIGTNPCRAGIRLPPLDESKVIPLTQIQSADLAHALGGVLVDIGVGAGLRQGELFGISPDDIDYRRGVIYVRRQVKRITSVRQYVFALPKGHKQREVPLSSTLGKRIQRYVKQTDCPRITLPWEKADGKPLTVSLINVRESGEHWNSASYNERAWKPALKEVGIPVESHYGCHVLRHTYASEVLSRGADIRSLAEYLGHTNPAFTLKVYAHMLPSAHGVARSAIDDLLSGWGD
jgi:integrase